MTLQELGIILRAEREKRGLVIDDVAGRLKISARILRALEEGDAESLPHAVYVRGFVRSYSNYLGLDPEEMQGAVDQFEADEMETTSPSVYNPSDTDISRGSGKIFFLVFVVLCLVGAAVAFVYRDADLFSELQQARLTTAQPAPPLNPTPAPVKPTKAEKKTKASAPATPAQQSPPVEDQQKTSAPAAVQQPATPVALAAPTTPVAPALPRAGEASVDSSAPATTAPAPPVNGPHKIIITALSECWMHSNADSTDTRQFSLRKGDTFALTFSKKLVLKLGNAGGVRIRYNGQDLPMQGKEGQVKTLTFPEGQ